MSLDDYIRALIFFAVVCFPILGYEVTHTLDGYNSSTPTSIFQRRLQVRASSNFGGTAGQVITISGVMGEEPMVSDGVGTNARFKGPGGTSLSSDGRFAIITDANANQIRKLDMLSAQVTTVAGTGGNGGNDGGSTTATFNEPYGVALSADNSFALVAGNNDHRIRKVIISTGEVSTFVGAPTAGNSDGVGTDARLRFPRGVAISGDGVLAVIVDCSNDRIRKVIISTQVVSIIAGSSPGSSDGTGTSARFNGPRGVTVSSDGSFAVVTDRDNHRLRKLVLSTRVVTTIAGSVTGYLDGTGTNARFDKPYGIDISSDDTYVVVADFNSHRIRKCILSTGVVTTIAGGSSSGGLDGIGTNALFSGPIGISISLTDSYVLVADRDNFALRVLFLQDVRAEAHSKSTIHPTFVPTHSPTWQPTDSPTRVPTVSPTVVPTNAPTDVPTRSPTAVPTNTPTRQPTDSPTRVPTVSPTVVPTNAPTHVSTGHPTQFPSFRILKPSISLPLLPTSTPSVSTTSVPTSPSGHLVLSGRPTDSATARPTSVSSGIPTFVHPEQPTNVPTILPTLPHSILPTTGPTDVPSGIPTFIPSEHPTNLPTLSHSIIPITGPTGVPSGIHTSIPMERQIETPTSVPWMASTAGQSFHPTLKSTVTIASLMPSSLSSVSDSNSYSTVPTYLTTITATVSFSPTSSLSYRPTVSLSEKATANPTYTPTDYRDRVDNPTLCPFLLPSHEPSTYNVLSPLQHTAFPTALNTVVPTVMSTRRIYRTPRIVVMTIWSSQYSVAVTIGLSDQGTVFCGLFKHGTVQPSVNAIVAQNRFVAIDSSLQLRTVSLKGLQPLTMYDIYCLAKANLEITTTTEIDSFRKVTSTTSCCKRVIVTLTGTSFVSGTVVKNFISIHATGAPSNDLVISLSIGNSSGLLSNMLFPSSVTLNGKNWDNIHKVALTGRSTPGSYYTSVSLGGSSAQEFEVVFGNNGVQSFILESPNVEPTTPRLSSAAFSADGMYIIVVFDSPTDQARKLSSFSCEDVLILTGASESSCLWSTSSTLTITLKGINRPVVGDCVSVCTNSVRAQCRSDLSVCDQWTSVPSISIPIVAPLVPMIPVVAVSAPSTVGRCDEVLIDLTSSWPSGGRRWSSIAVNVTSSRVESAVAVEQFFATQYTISPPTSLPRGVLVAGYVYTFEIKLCNFLGACGIGFHQISAVDSALPVVSIAGQQSRTVSMASPLLLQAQGYTSFCDGTRSFANLIYTWTASRDGIIDHTLTSISPDKTKFKLPAFALRPNSVYDVVVTVVSSLSGLSSGAAVQLSIPSSKIVAAISGATERTIRQGDILIVDAAGSYDEESRTSAGLSFSWSCYQQEPTLSSTCDLQLQPALSHVMITSPYSTPTGNVYAITVTVHDSTRQSHETVMITVTERSAPQLSITSRNGAIKINPSDDLILYGSVLLQDMTTVTWTVDDPLLDLKSVSRTAVTAPLRHGSHQFNLVIPALVLSPKSTPYVFSLMSSGSRSSLAIAVNVPPSPGVFEVVPSNGTAMVTKFKFAASEWSDDDIPLSYEFAYIETQTSKVVHGRSEYSFATSLLPPGRSNDDLLLCQVRVFDVLNAYSSESVSLIVNDPQMTSSALLRTIGHLISSSDGNIDAQKETLSVVSSVLNRRNCSSAPRCSDFNRNGCSAVANTCGNCLLGYFGTDGDDNSICHHLSSLAVFVPSRLPSLCMSDFDCAPWEFCYENSMNGFPVCNIKLKECKSGCSGHGICFFRDRNTRLEINACFMSDYTCEAVCICESGFTGSNCGMHYEDFLVKRNIRSQLAFLLYNISRVDDVSADNIASWESSLPSITQNIQEISVDMARVTLSVVSSILNASYSYTSSLMTLSGAVNSLDAVAEAAVLFRSQGHKSWSSTRDIVDLLGTYGSTITGLMEASESSVETVANMFRITTTFYIPGSEIPIVMPQTNIEHFMNVSPISVILSSENVTNYQRVVLINLKSTLYKDFNNFSSDVMRIKLIGDDSPSMTIALRNFNTEIPLAQRSFVLNTTCAESDFSVHNLNCPSVNGDIRVTHICNGSIATIETHCPIVEWQRSCKVLDGGADYSCFMKSFSQVSTTCVCDPVTAIRSGEGRHLAGSFHDTGILEVVAISTLIVNSFFTTVTTADDLNSVSDLEDTIVVILLYGILWSGGLSGILLFSLRQCYDSDRVVGKESGKKKDIARSTMDKSDVKAYLTSYVNEVFPSVYRTKPALLRLWDEICKHHRYLVLFTANGSNGDSVRMLTGVHLLTVQSMLMFILAVCYDLQYPNDEGECSGYTTERECVRRKSPFDVDTSVCRWVEDADADDSYLCEYPPEEFNIRSFVIISIVVAIFTAPINLLVDFLFIEVLSAPTANALNVRSADETVLKNAIRIGRRISAVTIVSVSAAQQRLMRLHQRASIRGVFSLQTIRTVPEAASNAHLLATRSAETLLVDIQDRMGHLEARRKTMRKESESLHLKHKLEKHRKFLRERTSRVQTKKELQSIEMANYTDSTLQDLFIELTVDISEQRRVLKRIQQEGFDAMWGVDPTGEFSRQRELTFLCIPRTCSVERAIKSELKYVRDETQAKFEKLRFASDAQIGIEILHQFLMDILGRDTPVAKIFLTKSEEDFRHSYVVTKFVKAIAWSCVVVLNLFFVWFSMLRGLQRGYHWQKLYMIACVMQLVIEILFYETSECAIIHFFIPDLARNEVHTASFALHQAVNKICSSSLDAAANVILDAPRYLFVSTNLAKRFPNLLESAIVMSYHTYSPGEFSKKWRVSHSTTIDANVSPWSRSNRRVSRFAVSSALFGFMQHMGAMSPTVQRVTIHSLQPLVVSSLFLLWVSLWTYPLWSIPVAFVIIYKLYECVRGNKIGRYISPDNYSGDIYPLVAEIEIDTKPAIAQQSIHSREVSVPAALPVVRLEINESDVNTTNEELVPLKSDLTDITHDLSNAKHNFSRKSNSFNTHGKSFSRDSEDSDPCMCMLNQRNELCSYDFDDESSFTTDLGDCDNISYSDCDSVCHDYNSYTCYDSERDVSRKPSSVGVSEALREVFDEELPRFGVVQKIFRFVSGESFTVDKSEESEQVYSDSDIIYHNGYDDTDTLNEQMRF